MSRQCQKQKYEAFVEKKEYRYLKSYFPAKM